jgi:hypothetical protein
VFPQRGKADSARPRSVAQPGLMCEDDWWKEVDHGEQGQGRREEQEDGQ